MFTLFLSLYFLYITTLAVLYVLCICFNIILSSAIVLLFYIIGSCIPYTLYYVLLFQSIVISFLVFLHHDLSFVLMNHECVVCLFLSLHV